MRGVDIYQLHTVLAWVRCDCVFIAKSVDCPGIDREWRLLMCFEWLVVHNVLVRNGRILACRQVIMQGYLQGYMNEMKSVVFFATREECGVLFSKQTGEPHVVCRRSPPSL
jgi:hypothetical protein